ncbi:MAG: FAD-binding oxidoreductase [Anaerolineae bacterium]
MRRWNGWGDTWIDYPLPPLAARFLEDVLGPGSPPRDVALVDALRAVPPSRLPTHRLVTTDAEVRLRHACGQSLPDWVALRSARIPAFPDGVAFPASDDEVMELITFASQVRARVIPYGGGTSVVGHINPISGDSPVLTIDMSRLDGLLAWDESSQLATFGAGVNGPRLEARLRELGYRLGHFPQSFELSTLGGWVATRSSGQQSLYYGRIEDLFAGGRLIAPGGRLELPALPASAAGPDLRQLILGCEGRLGVIIQATLRVSRLPQREEFHALFFPTWSSGIAAVRDMVQARLPLSMLRLSDPTETTTILALAGHAWLVGLLERLLRLRGLGPERCMLIFGVTGHQAATQATRQGAIEAARAHGGAHAGRLLGNQWRKSRFRTPYLRNTLWERGYAVDTLETAIRWSEVPATAEAILRALRQGLRDVEERVHAFAHLSHVYPDGASIYITLIFRLAADPDETLHRWRLLKTAASDAIVAAGGTISHQHGVGVDHAPYLPAEKGALGMEALRALCRTFDPQGMMNPAKLTMDSA